MLASLIQLQHSTCDETDQILSTVLNKTPGHWWPSKTNTMAAGWSVWLAMLDVLGHDLGKSWHSDGARFSVRLRI